VGVAVSPVAPRASAYASLHAAASAACGSSRPDLPAPPPGRRLPPWGLETLARVRQRLATHHRRHGTGQPGDSLAGGRGQTPRHDAL